MADPRGAFIFAIYQPYYCIDVLYHNNKERTSTKRSNRLKETLPPNIAMSHRCTTQSRTAVQHRVAPQYNTESHRSANESQALELLRARKGCLMMKMIASEKRLLLFVLSLELECVHLQSSFVLREKMNKHIA